MKIDEALDICIVTAATQSFILMNKAIMNTMEILNDSSNERSSSV